MLGVHYSSDMHLDMVQTTLQCVSYVCYQLVCLFVDSVNPIRQCVGHIDFSKLMDNVAYAERISGIFIGTGIRREEGERASDFLLSHVPVLILSHPATLFHVVGSKDITWRITSRRK